MAALTIAVLDRAVPELRGENPLHVGRLLPRLAVHDDAIVAAEASLARSCVQEKPVIRGVRIMTRDAAFFGVQCAVSVRVRGHLLQHGIVAARTEFLRALSEKEALVRTVGEVTGGTIYAGWPVNEGRGLHVLVEVGVALDAELPSRKQQKRAMLRLVCVVAEQALSHRVGAVRNFLVVALVTLGAEELRAFCQKQSLGPSAVRIVAVEAT